MLLFYHTLTIVAISVGQLFADLKNKLEKLQNKAARIITGDSYEIRSDAIRSRLGWGTLQERSDKIMQ